EHDKLLRFEFVGSGKGLNQTYNVRDERTTEIQAEMVCRRLDLSPNGATDERVPDDRRVAIRHHQSWSLCRLLRGWGSSLAGSGFLGLTPPGYGLAPRSGLEKGRQRKSVGLESLTCEGPSNEKNPPGPALGAGSERVS
ncbi:MAG TPA: hypothetical protein VJY33_03475, partial [Isosphaeraceae bacterium]|nr:hypothetical protein [Isosphaeraceae bacterium]